MSSTRAELQTILGEVRNASQSLYGALLDKIILYGSYARGEDTKESDIDIMIVLNCDAERVRQLRSATSDMASDISLEQDVFLSVLLRDKKHFEENLHFLPFYQNIAKDGILVYG